MSLNLDDIEKEMVASLAEEMRKTMDFEVLSELFVLEGYTRIELDYGSKRTWFEVVEWVANNFTGKHREHNGVWLIEKEEDAIMFKLKWL